MVEPVYHTLFLDSLLIMQVEEEVLLKDPQDPQVPLVLQVLEV
jgi:hypothetical protein